MNMWTLDAILACFLAASFVHDRFAWLNQKADALESGVPLLNYNKLGDPASWVQHGLTACGVACAWGALGVVFGNAFLVGFQHGACIMLGFYIVREGWQAWEWAKEDGARGPFVDGREFKPRPENGWVTQAGYHAGWLVDGVLDVVGPALVCWLSIR